MVASGDGREEVKCLYLWHFNGRQGNKSRGLLRNFFKSFRRGVGNRHLYISQTKGK